MTLWTPYLPREEIREEAEEMCERNSFRRVTMAKGDQLGRQWKIIQTLIASKMGKSAAELARIWSAIPGPCTGTWRPSRWRGSPSIPKRWTVKHQIPLPFSLTELMALYFGRDMLKVFRGTVFYDSLDSLFTKREEIREEAERMAGRYRAPVVSEEGPSYARTQDHPLRRA